MNTTAILDKPIFGAVMNAAIIYDDFAGAAKANAVLERASYRAGEAALWSVKPWRLDLLSLPSTAAEALRDTTDAHLIVFALRPAQNLSSWLLDWLERWAAQRQVAEAALAVFSDENGDAFSTPVAPELSRFAERHGLNFIFDNGGPVRDESAHFVRDLHEREISMTPTLQQIMEESAYQHWGINE
jgi:hypothetical protein